MAIVAILIAMFAVNLKLALITAASVPLLALVSVYFQKRILQIPAPVEKVQQHDHLGFNEGITSARRRRR
jgi:ATP-binding cassette subfamily B protein